MKSEKLYDAITEIDESVVEEANVDKIKTGIKLPWKIVGTVAACAALTVGLAIGGRIAFPGASAGGGENQNPGESYMSYAGPAFPLAALENTDGIEFERFIDFDFSPFYAKTESYEDSKGETVYYDSYDSNAIVKDSYIATNTTDKDITFTAIYPFSGKIEIEKTKLPQISINGNTVETDIKIGPYSGGFDPVWGRENTESERWNLSSIESWYEYKLLLENGEYQNAAFSEKPELKQQVKVYSFNIEYNIDMSLFDEIDNPDAVVCFDYDADETKVVTYGFNGYTVDTEEGWIELSSAVPKSFNPDFGKNKMYVIVMGDDIDNISVSATAGFIENHNDKKEKTDAFSITYEKADTTLEEVILDIINTDDYIISSGEGTVRDMLSDEEYLGYIAEFMNAFGFLSENPAERYNTLIIDDIIYETGYVSRVMYITFEVTVPAGESVEISTSTLREASFDFFGEKNNRNTKGFDMVTRLGTNLNIVKQSASVSNTEEIEIIYNNFGFDIENEITSVILGDEEHYWMEIAKK